MQKFHKLRFRSKQDQFNYIAEERIKALEDGLDDLRNDLRLIKALLTQTDELKQVIDETLDERENLELLRAYKRKLQILRAQEATYSTPPVEIILQREETEAKIADLKRDLNDSESDS